MWFVVCTGMNVHYHIAGHMAAGASRHRADTAGVIVVVVVTMQGNCNTS
jgi:hypothetical protein